MLYWRFFWACWALWACGENSPLEKDYQNLVKKYYMVRFFQDADLTQEIASHDSPEEYYKVFYTQNNRIFSQEHYKSHILHTKTRYIYDSQAVLSSQITYNSQDQKLKERIYKTNETIQFTYSYKDGKLSSVTSHSNNTADGWWIYYHPSGKVSHKIHYTQGAIDSTWRYTYHQGELLQERHYNQDGKLIYSYTFR